MRPRSRACSLAAGSASPLAVTRSWAIPLLLCACAAAAVPARAAAAAVADSDILEALPRHELAAAAVANALARADRPARPQRYAVPVPLALPLAAGRWHALEGGMASWRLRLGSPGARSLSARLDPFAMPEGAELWIRGAGATRAYGPYGAAQAGARGFWTPVVAGSELVLEVRVPAVAAGDVRLAVAEVFHGYANFGGKTGGAGTSGACNVDADCESANWGDEARSVARITIANQYYCSGQLLNNVEQDQAPLFLTARHCGVNHDRGAASSVNFYFDFAAACGQPAPAEPEATVIGATFLADDASSDFTLLRMNGPAPANAYFAGWNATGQGAASGASLHHPSGDARKISLFDTPLTQSAVSIGSACNIEAWEVHWASGTTEGGSSGGGLWSSSRQVIGVLSGGTASCENPTGADYYGRLDRAWTASLEPNGQLKAHLDPGNTCIAAIPGLDPDATPNAKPITTGPERCEAALAQCQSGGGGGGALPASLLLPLVLAARRRRARA
jgi:lysyl endopeptidase